jgi:pimeloyl-ACP methyl ester carboxylesterase
LRRALWREVPSRFVIGEKDQIIPAELQHYMAERAHAHRTLEIPGGSHAITVSHPRGRRPPDPGGRGGSRGRLRLR